MLPHLHVFFGLSISTYFLIISLSCTASALWFIKRAEDKGLQRVTAIDITLVVLIAGFLGARLLHVVFEDFGYYRVQPIEIFYVWNGGFVFLGGLVASLIAGILFCHWKHEPFWFWADVAALPAALSYALGRLGCFFNGCCYGNVCELPWAISLQGMNRHPTQLYATLWELISLGILFKLEPRFKVSGTLFNTWLITHAVGRIIMETFRADPRGNLVLGLSIGTLMSLGLAAWAAMNLLASRLQSKDL